MNRLKAILGEATGTEERPFVVAVDFDGTCTNEKEYKEDMVLSLQNNVAFVLNEWRGNGIYLILWTCRASKALKQATDFLKEHIGFEFDSVNENYKGMPFKTSNKIFADIYVDDRNVYSGKEVDWIKMKEYVNNAHEEWKKTR